MNPKIIERAVAAIGILVVLLGVLYVIGSSDVREVACTEEAKLCPDGSGVGRTGPNCEFAPCPTEDDINSWKTFSDLEAGISFSYPETFETTYIDPFEWPPQITFIDEPFSCTEVNVSDAHTEKTELRSIAGRGFCVTEVVGGALGSIYSQYTYIAEHEGKTVAFMFTIRIPQCANYSEVESGVCENEQRAFNLDAVFGRVAETLQLR